MVEQIRRKKEVFQGANIQMDFSLCATFILIPCRNLFYSLKFFSGDRLTQSVMVRGEYNNNSDDDG